MVVASNGWLDHEAEDIQRSKGLIMSEIIPINSVAPPTTTTTTTVPPTTTVPTTATTTVPPNLTSSIVTPTSASSTVTINSVDSSDTITDIQNENVQIESTTHEIKHDDQQQESPQQKQQEEQQNKQTILVLDDDGKKNKESKPEAPYQLQPYSRTKLDNGLVLATKVSLHNVLPLEEHQHLMLLQQAQIGITGQTPQTGPKQPDRIVKSHPPGKYVHTTEPRLARVLLLCQPNSHPFQVK